MQSSATSQWRIFSGIMGAIFAPVFLMFVWLWAAGKERHQDIDSMILFLGLAAGFACTFLLPMRWYWRIGLFLLYMPAQLWVVFFLAVSYVCGAYGDCL